MSFGEAVAPGSLILSVHLIHIAQVLLHTAQFARGFQTNSYDCVLRVLHSVSLNSTAIRRSCLSCKTSPAAPYSDRPIAPPPSMNLRLIEHVALQRYEPARPLSACSPFRPCRPCPVAPERMAPAAEMRFQHLFVSLDWLLFSLGHRGTGTCTEI